MNDGGEIRGVPQFAPGEEIQVVDQILERMERQADKGDLYPDWAGPWCQRIKERLERIAAKANETWEEEA